jgi:hypothetical protein
VKEPELCAVDSATTGTVATGILGIGTGFFLVIPGESFRDEKDRLRVRVSPISSPDAPSKHAKQDQEIANTDTIKKA